MVFASIGVSVNWDSRLNIQNIYLRITTKITLIIHFLVLFCSFFVFITRKKLPSEIKDIISLQQTIHENIQHSYLGNIYWFPFDLPSKYAIDLKVTGLKVTVLPHNINLCRLNVLFKSVFNVKAFCFVMRFIYKYSFLSELNFNIYIKNFLNFFFANSKFKYIFKITFLRYE